MHGYTKGVPIDTDAALAANSDQLVPSQKAVKTYIGAHAGTGTVTSVGQTVPSDLLAVTGTPVTSAGSLDITLPVRPKNKVFAGPATGADATPNFRSLVLDDLPTSLMMAIEIPAGVVDGLNGTFTLAHTPISDRVIFFADDQQLIGGVDYSRTGRTVTMAFNANKPRFSVYASYPYIGAFGSGTVETFPAGTLTTWTAATLALAGYCVAYSPALRMYAATDVSGTTAAIYTSVDGGTSWQAATTPTNIRGSSWRAICWNETTSTFLVTNSNFNDAVMKSTDGVTWTQSAATGGVYNSSPGGLLWVAGLGLYVQGVIAGGVGRIATSPDGNAWTVVGPNVGQAFRGFACGRGTVVAVAHYYVYSSIDGVTWTPETIPGINGWEQVAYSPELDLFVIVGMALGGGSGTLIMSAPGGFVPGAMVMTQRTPSAAGSDWIGVVWSRAKQLFVALSNTWASPNDIINVSADGQTWAAKATPAETPVDIFANIAAGDESGSVVAVCTSGLSRAMVSFG